MGLFWDLYQQSQISQQEQRSSTLEDRVSRLEADLLETRQLLRQVLGRLEESLGEDINHDGRIG